jgi:hypothetical protein
VVHITSNPSALRHTQATSQHRWWRAATHDNITFRQRCTARAACALSGGPANHHPPNNTAHLHMCHKTCRTPSARHLDHLDHLTYTAGGSAAGDCRHTLVSQGGQQAYMVTKSRRECACCCRAQWVGGLQSHACLHGSALLWTPSHTHIHTHHHKVTKDVKSNAAAEAISKQPVVPEGEQGRSGGPTFKFQHNI